MAASSVAEVGSLGGASGIAIPAFIGSSLMFAGGCLGASQSTINLMIALQTPDGMDASEFSMIKEVVKGFGGGPLSQEGSKLIFDLAGLKGMTKITEKGLLFLVERLWASGMSAEQIINFLEELEKTDNNNNNNDNNSNDHQDDDDHDDDNQDDDEKKKKDNSWWSDYDPANR